MLERADLENILNRVHAWTWQVDQKVSIFLTAQAAILAVLLQPLAAWLAASPSILLRTSIVLGGLLQIAAILCSALALFPRTRNPTRTPSVTFFGDIASLELEAYQTTLGELSASDYALDLTTQIHVSARIVRSKFQWFKCAVVLSGLGLAVLGVAHLI